MSIYDKLADKLNIESDGLFSHLDPKSMEGLEFIPIPLLNSMEAKQRNAVIVTCDVCGVSGNEPNMRRWHFEKCRQAHEEKICIQCDEIIPINGDKPVKHNAKIYCNQSCYMESKRGIPPIEMTDEVKQKLRKQVVYNNKTYNGWKEFTEKTGISRHMYLKYYNDKDKIT